MTRRRLETPHTDNPYKQLATSLLLVPDTLDHGYPLGNQIEKLRRKRRTLFPSRLASLGVVGPKIPNLQSVASRLCREIGRPSQNIATRTFAEPITAQHQAFADFQRLSFQSQFQVTLHILAEQLHGFFENFPGRLRRLDVPPLMATRAGVQIVIIQRPDFIFNLRRHVLVVHLVQERSRYLLGLADKIGMRFQKTPQDSGAFIRLQALKSKAPLSCCSPLWLTLRSHLLVSKLQSKYRVHLHRSISRNGIRGVTRPGTWVHRTDTTFPSPVQAEAFPMPGDHGFGFDDQQRGSPVGPQTGEPNPQKSVHS